MQANEANLLTIIMSAKQFSVPIYQRSYNWTERECKQLLVDILDAGSKESLV